MAGRGVELAGGRELDHVAEIHHRNAVGDMLDHREVVGDEEIGEAELLLQILEQVHHLGLDGDVEGTHRLIADDQAGAQGQGASDADPLALPAAEGVRVAIHVLGLEADAAEQFGHLGPHVALGLAVDLQGLADDVEDGHAGIQRGEGVLKDDLHLAAQFLQAGLVQLGHINHLIALAEEHLAGGWLVGPQDHAAGGGLAAAALAHQAERLPLMEGEAYAVHGAHMPDGAPHKAPLDGEVLLQIAYVEQNGAGRFHSTPSGQGVFAALRMPDFPWRARRYVSDAVVTPGSLLVAHVSRE